MTDKFTFSDNYKKTFIGMAVLGLILFIGGYFLSNAHFGEEHGHGDGGHGTEHAAPASHDGHSDASNGSMVRFASADHSATPEHGDAHGHDSHGEMDPSAFTNPNGTVWRAPVHPDQVHHAHHAEPTEASKFGGVLLIAGWWWLAVALFGVFFQAFSAVANAGWYVSLKRVPEVFYRFIPIGGVVLLVAFLALGKNVYEWVAVEPGADALIDSKRSFLNPGFYITALLISVVLWTFFGHMFRTNSLKEDQEGGVGFFKKNIRLGAAFLPIFGVSFCLAAFQWLMSLEPHWFSTIFAVYIFAGTFAAGITIIMLIVVSLKEKGYLPQVTSDHLHDLGKLMFAFSVFWAYIWVSQYLLIWYANIPEETVYYFKRYENYGFLFMFNVVLNFAFPFLALMTRESKRQYGSLKTIAVVMLFGRFVDIFLVVMPGVLGAHWNGGVFFMALGAMLVFGAIFFYLVYHGLAGANLVPVNHPYLEESKHHSTGV